MNSEVPPIPESDQSKLDSSKPLGSSLEELKVESTSASDTTNDAWLEDDIIDLTVEPEVEPERKEPELTESTTQVDLSAAGEKEEEETVASEIITSSDSEQDTEIVDGVAQKSLTESELFVDSWLDEPKADLPDTISPQTTSTVAEEEKANSLQEQKISLQEEIEALKAQKEELLWSQGKEIQESMARIFEEATKELEERKKNLQIDIERLERRKARIEQEMRASFAGSSQELALKVKGFKEYLVGSLQDLVSAAEKLELSKAEVSPSQTPSRSRNRNYEYYDDDFSAGAKRNRDDSRSGRDPRGSREKSRESRRDPRSSRSSRERNSTPSAPQGQFSEPTFADQSRRIRQLIDKYRNNPDYYGSPWQLRRTFEPIHAKKVQDWFFVQGGRGAVDTMGSRLQNILVASAAISILHNIYGDRCRVLVLTDTPENLGEWRRGLQDCLGISRNNFGSNRGVTLFDSPEVVVQRAERLIDDKLLPVIIIDETEELLNLSVLKFPLWLAFASSAKPTSSNYLY